MPTTILVPEAILPRADSASLRVGVAIAVEDSRIAAIDTPEQLRLRWPAGIVLDLPGCLVMPGLINAHQHGRGLSQIQLGYQDDFLEPWISNRRGRGVLDPYAITKLAAARMLAKRSRFCSTVRLRDGESRPGLSGEPRYSSVSLGERSQT